MMSRRQEQRSSSSPSLMQREPHPLSGSAAPRARQLLEAMLRRERARASADDSPLGSAAGQQLAALPEPCAGPLDRQLQLQLEHRHQQLHVQHQRLHIVSPHTQPAALWPQSAGAWHHRRLPSVDFSPGETHGTPMVTVQTRRGRQVRLPKLTIPLLSVTDAWSLSP